MKPPAVQLAQLPASCNPPGVAVLFPDTCALLDIVRLSTRGDTAHIRRELAAIAQVIQSATRSPPLVMIVIAPPIMREWDNNIGKVLSETDKVAAQWLAQGERFAEVQGRSQDAVNVQACTSFLSAGASLRSLAESIIHCAIEIAPDEPALARAMRRISMAQAPARKGEQAKDCMVIEHVLAAAGSLNSTTPARKAVFLSSNTYPIHRAV